MYSENKGADQLCSYCTADLRLCFRLGNNPVFSRCGSYDIAKHKGRFLGYKAFMCSVNDRFKYYLINRSSNIFILNTGKTLHSVV